MKAVVLVSLLLPLVRAFEFTEPPCPEGHFRSLDDGVQSCKVCYKPTFRAAYGVDAVGVASDHPTCCTSPDHPVCQAMKAEYEANCPCAGDNGHCFAPGKWDPSGVNVLHMDLSLLADNTTFQYSAAAGEDTVDYTTFPAGYTKDSTYSAYVSFVGIIPGGPEVVDQVMTIENQRITINCTTTEMAPWCASTVHACSHDTALLIVSTLHIPDHPEWWFTLTATLLNRHGVPGDIDLHVVDNAETMYQYDTVLNQNVTAHDQWELENNLVQCITRPGEECASSRRRRRRRLRRGKAEFSG